MPAPVPVLVVTNREELSALFAPSDSIARTVVPSAGFDPAIAARFSLAILDFEALPNGVAAGRRLRRENPQIEFIAVVSDERSGVAAVRAGGLDYLLWPPSDASQPRALLDAAISRFAESGAQTLGRFRLLRRIGVGGMAEVFLAQATNVPGFLAIKRILPGISRDREFLSMFMDEARISAILTHPNIVRTVDFGSVDGTLFLALEFVQGRTLAQVLRERSRLSPRLVAHIGAEVASALGYAHEKTDPGGRALGIVHRDVNPPNVLLSEDGRVMLGDFGIAKARQRQTQTTHGAVKGKLDYLSPEQLLGLPLDGRSDLWSLGVLLYVALTGVQPFRGSGPALTLKRIREGKVEPPSAIVPEIPPAIEAIVLRALARDRDARYATAAALVDDLRAALNTLGPVRTDEIAALAREAATAAPSAEPSTISGRAVQEIHEATRLSPMPREPVPLEPSTDVTAIPRRIPAVAPARTAAAEATVVPAAAPLPAPGAEPREPIAPSSAVETQSTPIPLRYAASKTRVGATPEDPPPIFPRARPRSGRRIVLALGAIAIAAAALWARRPAPQAAVPVSSLPMPTATLESAGVPVESPTVAPTTTMTPRRTPTPRVASSAGTGHGTLTIWISDGWATVTIDGKGPPVNAPIVALDLAEGTHHLVVENAPQKFRREYDVKVSAGRESKLSISLR